MKRATKSSQITEKEPGVSPKTATVAIGSPDALPQAGTTPPDSGRDFTIPTILVPSGSVPRASEDDALVVARGGAAGMVSGGSAISPTEGVIRYRTGQRALLRGMRRYRKMGYIARRQYGKTTTLSGAALFEMGETAGADIVFGSVKLNLAREVVRKEQQIITKAITQAAAARRDLVLTMADSKTGRDLKGANEDDLAEIFEASRFEFRLYHSNSVYSRTKVVALGPDTVGETGHLYIDEVTRARNWQETWEAVEPIISSNPKLRCVLSGTPPPDDTHLSFAQLCPPPGMEFTPNPAGNWYRSDMGLMVLRVDAYDAFADNVPLYDDETGQAITPSQSRERAYDKDAWDRNYGCQFLVGGTAAVGLVELNSAQARGVNQCGFFIINSMEDLRAAMDFVKSKLGSGRVGMGWDLATTEKQTSNPNGWDIVEERGSEFIHVATLVWKTADPATARRYAHFICDSVAQRPAGGRPRRLCIDGTNERYFAIEMQRELAAKVPVEIVIGSETITMPGHEEPMTMKAYTGRLYCNTFADNRCTLAAHPYLKADHRRVKNDRGSFICELGPNGEHGDTFDAGKLSTYSLLSNRSGAIEDVSTIGYELPATAGFRRPIWRNLRRLS